MDFGVFNLLISAICFLLLFLELLHVLLNSLINNLWLLLFSWRIISWILHFPRQLLYSIKYLIVAEVSTIIGNQLIGNILRNFEFLKIFLNLKVSLLVKLNLVFIVSLFVITYLRSIQLRKDSLLKPLIAWLDLLSDLKVYVLSLSCL